MDQEENYPWLLEEVSWSLAAKKIDGLEPFYEELKDYNKEWGLPDYIDSELGFKEVTIIYEYSEEVGNDWIDRTEEVNLVSASESFSELELLYQLHNHIQQRYEGVDRHWFEGLQLEQEGPELKYSLVLGS